MSTQFRPLEIPPGVVSNPTKQMRSSNWAEVNLMRWVEGQLTPVGGQAAYTYSFASRCKLIHGWYDLSDVYHIAYLCEANLYVDTGGVLVDITPAGGITPPQPLTEGGYGDGAYGQNVVLAATAAWAPGAANIQMTANPGSVQPGMDVYNTTQNLHVGMVVAFTGGVLSLAAPGAEYAGNAGDILNFDWYGMPRAISDIQALDKVPDAWSLDNFGAILLAMTSPDGRLLQFDPGKGTPGVGGNPTATAAWTTGTTIPIQTGLTWIEAGMNVYNTTNASQVGTVASYATATGILTLTAPAANPGAANEVLEIGNVATPVIANSGRGIVPTGRCFVVTNERFVMMMGAYNSTNGGGPRRFAWCDQENFQAWDYANVTSQAGFLDIEPASPIICAKAGPLGVLFWTANSTYISAFLGVPYIYNYTEIAKNSTPWSACSVVATTMLTLWMSQQGMFSYNGAWVAPVACKVRTWIDDDIDILNVREQACAVNVAAFNEFWWFFPQGPANNPSGYNTRCVYYNYKEGHWGQGQMSRSAGIASTYVASTIMADGTVAYQHELYNSYPANVPLPWAETFDLNLASGSRLVTVKQMIPDIQGDVTNLLYSLIYKNSRSIQLNPAGGVEPVIELQSAPKTVNPNGFVDFRTTGRDVRLRIALAGPQVNPVTVGQHLIDSVARGDR